MQTSQTLHALIARPISPKLDTLSLLAFTLASNSKFSRKGLYHIGSLTNATDVRVDGVPPACMNLATVLTGQPTQEGEPVPVPMGSASLEYQDLTHDELIRLAHTLEANGDVQ